MFAFKNIFSLVNSNSHCLFSAIMNGIASLGQYSAVILFHLTYQELSIQGKYFGQFSIFCFFILTGVSLVLLWLALLHGLD